MQKLINDYELFLKFCKTYSKGKGFRQFWRKGMK